MKMNNFKGLLILLFLTMIYGCGSSPSPNYINGQYFMGGDDNCIQYKTLANRNIACYTKDGQYTGERAPISEMQAKAWYDRQQQAMQSVYQPYKPTQTFCNNIAGTVICNSF